MKIKNDFNPAKVNCKIGCSLKLQSYSISFY